MRYRTKVTVVTGGKEYKPGSILPADISDSDLDFLKSKDFVSPAEVPPDGCGEEDGFFGFQEGILKSCKSPDQIRKIRSKQEVFSYAASVGLDLGEDFEKKGLKDLQEEVINFQEEKVTNDFDDDPEEDEEL